MAKLDNSRRFLLQAVHTPVTLPATATRRPGRGLHKLGLVAALGKSRLLSPGAASSGRHAATLDKLDTAFTTAAGGDMAAAVALIDDIGDDELLATAKDVQQSTERDIDRVNALTADLLDKLGKPDSDPAPSPAVTAGTVRPSMRVPGASIREETIAKLAPAKPRPSGTTSLRGQISELNQETQTATLERPRSASRTQRTSVQALTLDAIATRAAARGHEALAKELQALTQKLNLDGARITSGTLRSVSRNKRASLSQLVSAFQTQMKVEPIGLLHLERVTFAPDGIERGELVGSIPLAPGEEVTVAHKSWSTTTEEFQKLITDYMEEYSEEGVSEKTEAAQATTAQRQHSSGFNTSVSATGGFGPVSVTATAGFNVADASQTSAQTSRNQTMALTRKASSRSKTEHKTSFRVVTSSGTEDVRGQRIKNPSPDAATRIDYYQLIRKWQVNHFRYGLRLTYDLTIPEPGADVLSRIREIADLNTALQEGFGKDAVLPWARFDLTPQDIFPENYLQIASEYQASVPAPPAAHQWFSAHMEHKWQTEEEGKHSTFWALEVTVPDDYEVVEVQRWRNWREWLDLDNRWLNLQGTDDMLGTSGKQVLVYETVGLSSAYVELKVLAAPRLETLIDWQMRAWATIRDAAQARYYEMRQTLKDRLAKLMESLGADDALSLRRMEREEIMKGVLRWLFGPAFAFNPQGMPADLYGMDESVQSSGSWRSVLSWGELIKFLHQAIEWENVLFFLYPYFWSHLERWELKKHLEHPDPMHRAFLRSGSARVVLTLRPGFERDFLSLVETGKFDAIANTHPYMTIVQEMEAYAKTNYPGIPPANPEQADLAEQGQLVGTWFEYTPTSALDIAFGETLPTA